MLDMDKQSNQASGKPKRGSIVSRSDWWSESGVHPMKQWRKHCNVTLDDLSFLTGISTSSLSRIENFKQTPLISAAKKIIEASRGSLEPSDFFGTVQ
jgi:DNA-binding XRE family transcriptional regulator